MIGVVKDFHYKSLHHEIEPLVIMMGEWGWTRDFLSIRIRPDDVAGTLDFLRNQWREALPNTPFEYSFLDTSFDRLYRTEARLGDAIRQRSPSWRLSWQVLVCLAWRLSACNNGPRKSVSERRWGHLLPTYCLTPIQRICRACRDCQSCSLADCLLRDEPVAGEFRIPG